MDIVSVARKAGVSTATVSRVLNGSSKVRESTAMKVRAAIEELNYRPNSNARTLRSGRSNLYGVIVSDLRNPFFPDLIEQFESLANQQGIDVIISNTGYSEERLLGGIERLLERGVDGLAVLTSEVSEPTKELVRSVNVPVVFLNQPSFSAEFRTILVDYHRGFTEAIEHLRMLGHSRIGFVSGPPTLDSANLRRTAFFAAIASCGLEVRREWVFEGDHRLAGGRFAAERLFTMRHPPTAMVCSNDLMAIGFLETCSRRGRRIPEEFSVIGFDDLFLCEVVHPALTTIHLSRTEIATRAFYALQSRQEGAAGGRSSVISPYLVPRASTGPLSEATRSKS